MAMKFSGSLVLVLVTISVFATAIANKTYQAANCPPCPGSGGSGWGWGNVTHEPKKIAVGGDHQWQFGFNYAAWAWNYSFYNRFYVGDTLVFKYPNDQHKHSVVLMHNFQSYNSCAVKNGTVVAGPDDGNKGFEFKLTAKQQGDDPFAYFACGVGDGIHCNQGLMKFAVWALHRPST